MELIEDVSNSNTPTDGRVFALHELAGELHSSQEPVRYVPIPPITREQHNVSLARIPHARTWPIPRELANTVGPFQSIIFAAPNIWQMEPIIFHAAQELGIPSASGVAYNPPVTLEMARQLPHSLVVVSATHAAEYLTVITEARGVVHTVFAWISHIADTSFIHPALFGSSFVQVVEILPGYPIMRSCPLSGEKIFHLSREYAWYAHEKETAIAPTGSRLWDGFVRLPFSLKKTTMCRCGENAYVINVAR